MNLINKGRDNYEIRLVAIVSQILYQSGREQILDKERLLLESEDRYTAYINEQGMNDEMLLRGIFGGEQT